MSITSKLESETIKVAITYRCWRPTRKDRAQTARLERETGASKGAGKAVKDLFPKSFTQEIAALHARIRVWFATPEASRVLGRSDDGAGILLTGAHPATGESGLMRFNDKLNQFKAEQSEMLVRMRSAYPEVVASAPQRLGTMYDPQLFPPVDYALEQYGFEVRFSPVSSSSDFRCRLAAEELEEVQASHSKSLREMESAVTGSILARYRAVLSQIANSMEKSERLHASLFSKLEELVESTPTLNIMGDKLLEGVCAQCWGTILRHRVEECRDDEAVKERVGKMARAILSTIPATPADEEDDELPAPPYSPPAPLPPIPEEIVVPVEVEVQIAAIQLLLDREIGEAPAPTPIIPEVEAPAPTGDEEAMMRAMGII